MESSPTQDTHFHVDVVANVVTVKNLRSLLSGLLTVVAFLTYIVVLASATPFWLRLIVLAVVTYGLLLSYRSVKSRVLARYGCGLVRDELELSNHRVRILSFKSDGSFVATHTDLSTRKVHGEMKLVNSSVDGVFLRYHLDLFTE